MERYQRNIFNKWLEWYKPQTTRQIDDEAYYIIEPFIDYVCQEFPLADSIGFYYNVKVFNITLLNLVEEIIKRYSTSCLNSLFFLFFFFQLGVYEGSQSDQPRCGSSIALYSTHIRYAVFHSAVWGEDDENERDRSPDDLCWLYPGNRPSGRRCGCHHMAGDRYRYCGGRWLCAVQYFRDVCDPCGIWFSDHFLLYFPDGNGHYDIPGGTCCGGF